MRLSIVIVSWNVCKDLIQCLDSIRKYRPSGKYEVIVVDNASTDDTVDVVKSRFPEVMMIVNSDNKGFAAANNQGIEKSQSQYILLLNPDTILHPGSLDLLIDFMDSNKEVMVCGPKLLNDDGTIQRSVRRFPTFRGALYRHTAFRFLRLFRKDYEKWLMKDFDHKSRKEVDQLMGAALMIRKAVIDRIGGMDERFFMYYEEVDLCYRIKQAGGSIVFVPEALITHLGSRSSRQIPARKRIMMLTSLLEFFRKHRGKSRTAVFNCFFKPAVILRDICGIISGAFSYMFSVMTINSQKRKKSAAKIKTFSVLLGKYCWQLIKI